MVEPTPTPSPKPTVDAIAALSALLQGGGTTGGVGQVYLGTKTETLMPPAVIAKPGAKPTTVTVPNTVSLQEASKLYLTDPKLQASWKKTLAKFGMDTDPVNARKAWETAVAGASDWYVTSGNTLKVTPQDYLGWYARSKGYGAAAANIPTRQIYKYTPEQIDNDINTLAQKVLGRTVTDADKSAQWYKDLVGGINQMVNEGVVTTVKEVKNPKTGKMEKQVVQTPGFSQEKEQAKIIETLKTSDPQALERKSRLDFTSWLFGNMSGGQ